MGMQKYYANITSDIPYPYSHFWNSSVPVTFTHQDFENQYVPVTFTHYDFENQPVPVTFPYFTFWNRPVPVTFTHFIFKFQPVPVTFTLPNRGYGYVKYTESVYALRGMQKTRIFCIFFLYLVITALNHWQEPTLSHNWNTQYTYFWKL